MESLKCVECGVHFGYLQLVETKGNCPNCETHLYMIGPNALISDASTVSRVHTMIDNTLSAWNVMAEASSETRGLIKSCPTPKAENEMKEAFNHANKAYEQEINGFRDHLKILIGML